MYVFLSETVYNWSIIKVVFLNSSSIWAPRSAQGPNQPQRLVIPLAVPGLNLTFQLLPLFLSISNSAECLHKPKASVISSAAVQHESNQKYKHTRGSHPSRHLVKQQLACYSHTPFMRFSVTSNYNSTWKTTLISCKPLRALKRDWALQLKISQCQGLGVGLTSNRFQHI